MSWVLTKLAGLVLIILPVAVVVGIVLFPYSTHMLLEILGLLALGMSFLVVSILCIWAGIGALTISSGK